MSKGRSPSPVKSRSTQPGIPIQPVSSKPELKIHVFSGIANILRCVQKSLNEDRLAEAHNIVLISVQTNDIPNMLEQAEIVISEPKLIAPHLRNFKCLKWMQSTWAGVDTIFKQLKLDKNEHEQRTKEYNKFQEEMELQRQTLDAQKKELIAHLGGVDLALSQARAQISAMTKQHLEELRSMNNPPAIVKCCLEAVAMLLVPSESHPMPWENIRKLTRKDDFIQNVLDFDGFTQNFPMAAIATIKSQYLSQPNFTQKNIEYASKACGPFMGWLEAQIQFGDVMSEHAPLIAKLKELQKRYSELLAKCDSVQAPPVVPQVPSYQVTRMAGVFGVAMAEYVFGNILSLERDLPRLRKLQQESTWLPSGEYPIDNYNS